MSILFSLLSLMFLLHIVRIEMVSVYRDGMRELLIKNATGKLEVYIKNPSVYLEDVLVPYNTFQKVTFYQMCFKIWKPIGSFYTDKELREIIGDN